MDFLVKKLSEAKENNLEEELDRWCVDTEEKPRFGQVQLEQDFVINTQVEKKERIYIRPNNPIVKKGTLLGMKKAIPSDLGSLKACASYHEDGVLELTEPKTKDLDDLLIYERSIPRKLFVLGDYIQIVKSATVKHCEGNNEVSTKAQTVYSVTHFIEVLDTDDIYRIPTSLFAEKDSPNSGMFGGMPLGPVVPMNDISYTGVALFEQLDLVKLEKIYNDGVLEEIVSPLKPIA